MNSDIGARHYFRQADFFMPELLLEELWDESGSNTDKYSVMKSVGNSFCGDDVMDSLAWLYSEEDSI